jgi:electron transport complex protein RnfG
MSDQAITSSESRKRSLHMLKAMVGIGSMCALLIVFTYESTLSQIKENRAEALEKAIFKVLPEATASVPYEVSGSELSIKGEEATTNPVVYAGYNEANELIGFAIDAKGQGYADILRILYGYDPEEQTVKGLYVLESKETPGLGDKIEKDASFLANFEGLDAALNANNEIQNRITTVKSGEKKNNWEIDGITGATISSRAIGEIIGTSSLELVPVLFDAANEPSIAQKPEL